MVQAPSGFGRLFISVVMGTLAILGAAISTLTGQTNHDPSGLQIFYWYMLPALPFVVLSLLALFPSVIHTYMVIGAACGAILAIAIPYLLLWFSLTFYSGGGANIGLGLLFLAMPVYLVLFMVGGSAISRFLHRLYS